GLAAARPAGSPEGVELAQAPVRRRRCRATPRDLIEAVHLSAVDRRHLTGDAVVDVQAEVRFCGQLVRRALGDRRGGRSVATLIDPGSDNCPRSLLVAEAAQQVVERVVLL